MMTDMATKAVTEQAKTKATEAVTKSASLPETNATTSTSLKDQGIDMAAEQAEKTVGKETLKKETAKTAIKAVL